jgi:hypothetical protein
VRITRELPDTAFEPATSEQMSRLLKIVLAVHPELAVDEEAFLDAFLAAGLMFRTLTQAKDRFFYDIVGAANAMLEELFDVRPVSSAAFLAACFAHGDICWQRPDASQGALLEIGLCPTHGIKLTRPNRWRALLSGEANLLAPTSPRVGPFSEPSPVRILQKADWR